MNHLREFASVRDHEVLDAIEAANGNKTQAAADLGINVRSLHRKLVKLQVRAAQRGISPEHDMTHATAPGFVLRGTSTLYDADGSVKIQWVKTREDAKNCDEIKEAFLDAFRDEIVRVSPTHMPSTACDQSLLCVYVYGDPHIGLRAWGEETGEDHDLAKAESLFIRAHDDLVERSPVSSEAIILNLGDYFHADDGQNRTLRSGHSLDVDGRYQKVRRVGFRILREMIRMSLRKHEKVTVWNVIGNHDDYSSIDLGLWLQVAYENEPRVHIETSASKFLYKKFGNVMLMATHGDSLKHDMLLGVMASDQPGMWGSTKFRFAHVGHIHHKSVKDLQGVCIESHRVLQPSDLWAHNSGYRAQRDAQCICYHSEFGEHSRVIVNPSML